MSRPLHTKGFFKLNINIIKYLKNLDFFGNTGSTTLLTSLSTVHVIASKPNTIAEDDTQEDGESHTLCHIRYVT